MPVRSPQHFRDGQGHWDQDPLTADEPAVTIRLPYGNEVDLRQHWRDFVKDMRREVQASPGAVLADADTFLQTS